MGPVCTVRTIMLTLDPRFVAVMIIRLCGLTGYRLFRRPQLIR